MWSWRKILKYVLVWLPTIVLLIWVVHSLVAVDQCSPKAVKRFTDRSSRAFLKVCPSVDANLSRPGILANFNCSRDSSGRLAFDAEGRAASNLFVRLASRKTSKTIAAWTDRTQTRRLYVRRIGEGAQSVAVGKIYRYTANERNGDLLASFRNRLFVPLAAFVVALVVSLFVTMMLRNLQFKDDFLAAAAHDLMTPLVAQRGLIGRDEAGVRRYNDWMLRLVQNIRDFLRLGVRRLPKAERFGLMNAYRAAYAAFADDYRDWFDGEDVAVEADAGEAYAVRGDELLTVQILWNLLGNDLKYAAPQGRVRARFSLSEHPDGKSFVRLELVDEGQGMTRRQRAKAFNRYYRAKTVMASGKGGFGIGLCTAREYARAMGGDLTVRANVPRGCVFQLELPAAEGSENEEKKA